MNINTAHIAYLNEREGLSNSLQKERNQCHIIIDLNTAIIVSYGCFFMKQIKYKRLEGLTIQQLGLLHYFAKTKPWPRLPKLKQNQR